MNKSKWLIFAFLLGTLLCACGNDTDSTSVFQNSDTADSRMVSTVTLDGRLYELGKKSKYEYEEVTSFTEIDGDGSDYGVFQIAGDLRKVASVDGFATYEVSSGSVMLSYLPSYTLNDAPEQDWHLANDTSKSVNGEKLGNKISSGAVIVQISNDGEHWVTDQKMYDICGAENDVVDLYETKKIQQMNGCYYKVIVAYETERKPEKDTECRKNIEEYKFCIKDCANTEVYPNTEDTVSDNMIFVNTGKDNGYSKENEIDEKDPHKGWELGSFTIRGYSSYKENTNEEETNKEDAKCYIQEKEGSITLSFNLEQDINFLNEDEKLTIYSDKNGWDKYFQVDDTEFKHGMLIIQYTDMEGRKYQPNVYPDFLNLYAKKGVDTQIPLWGPGDYEVALDYEIKSGFGSYDNYKKSFKFKIRNKGEEEPDINKNYFGKLYELEEKYEYTETSPYEPIALSGSQFGVFSLSGNTAKTDYFNGYDAYDCSGGEIWLCYSPSGTLVDAPESDWHVVTEKKNKINNEKLDENIQGGAIILQTSKDGVNWLKDDEKTDITSDDFYTGFYDAKKIQLINGCYYRVIVAYGTERISGDSKEKENKMYMEVYEFYLKDGTAENNVKHLENEFTIGREYTINTGKDKEFYVPDDSTGWGDFESDDPYFGENWQIGTFKIIGYTDKEEIGQNEYIFTKNNDDVVKLVFRLEQNINCLNGNNNLIINSDKDGKDRNFQVDVDEFKHGTLIIHFTDSDNVPHTYKYVDFLEANARTGADTTVEFFEEGEYEIALDFEIKNKDSLFKKYSNYKMYFKFSIRNGKNTMYAFERKADGSKGSELSVDKTVVPDGFFIDLAESKYIKVDVTWYELVDTDYGKYMNFKWNKTASDEDVFYEPGIYEVTFTNKDQSRDSYTKTFYVGKDPYLKALSVNGLDVEGLNEKLREGYRYSDDGYFIEN